jgi:hypothetical protein
MKKKKFVSGFPKLYCDSEINFRNDFITIAAAFQKRISANQNSSKTWKAAKQFVKTFGKIKSFRKEFS